MPSVRTETLRIEGMTCVSCADRIQRELRKTPGIASAKVSYAAGTATVTFDENAVGLERIERLIERLDYRVNKTELAGDTNYTKLLGVCLIIFAFYMVLSRFERLNFFNVFPEAEAGMGYGMLFMIGLLTSVHCVAMCGGIHLSQCVRPGLTGGRFSVLRPSLLYNAGRVTAYTIVGGLVGALGSVVSFSGAAKGLVQLAAGVFMVIMGLNMLGIFPWLRRVAPRMPEKLAGKIQGTNKSPLYVGLLNGLMPCGPLQAMQLYALATGSLFAGALSMLSFGLGTVPLMFGLGTLSSFLNKKFTGKMMTASAVLVVIFGVSIFSSGMSLAGLSLGPSVSKLPSGKVAVIEDDVQTVTIALAPGRYEPMVVQKGIPVKLIIQAGPRTINGCNNRIIIPKYKLEQKLKPGENIIKFTPLESGTVIYSCWMGMIRSSITVVDDLSRLEPAPASDSQAAD